MHMFLLKCIGRSQRGHFGWFLVVLGSTGLCLEPLDGPMVCIWCRYNIYAVFAVFGRQARKVRIG